MLSPVKRSAQRLARIMQGTLHRRALEKNNTGAVQKGSQSDDRRPVKPPLRNK